MRHRVVSIALGLFLVGCQDLPQPTSIDELDDAPNPAPLQQPDRYIVSYSGASLGIDLIEQFGDQVIHEWEGIDHIVVRDLTDEDVEALREMDGVTAVSRDRFEKWIEEPGVIEVVELGDVEIGSHNPAGAAFFLGFQWNMRQIDADDAWGAGFEATPDVVVAILDTGINTPNGTGNIVNIDMRDLSFLSGFTPIVDLSLSRNVLTFTPPACALGGETLAPSNFDDYNFHGTHVGGIVNTNGIGTAGVAPHATLVAVKVLNCEGFGFFSDIIGGILYAASINVDVINMSLGADIPNIPEAAGLLNALRDAIDVAVDAGVYVVASAGNDARMLTEVDDDDFGEADDDDGTVVLSVPCQSHEDVACISATGPVSQTDFDRLASYSNFGEDVISVAAPGGDFLGVLADFILSPCSASNIPDITGVRGLPFKCGPGSFVFVVGTSQAAPHVAGLGAIVDAQFGGALDGDDIGEIVEDNADEVGPEATHGEGRINVLRALLETTDDDEDDDDDDDEGDDDDENEG